MKLTVDNVLKSLYYYSALGIKHTSRKEVNKMEQKNIELIEQKKAMIDFVKEQMKAEIEKHQKLITSYEEKIEAYENEIKMLNGEKMITVKELIENKCLITVFIKVKNEPIHLLSKEGAIRKYGSRIVKDHSDFSCYEVKIFI